MENVNQEKINEFEIDELIKVTYKKIAEWHNDHPTSIGLKHLCLELIEDIAGKAFEHIGLTYTPALQLDEVAKKALEDEKNKNPNTTMKPIDQMSDEELLEEIKKKKKNIS